MADPWARADRKPMDPANRLCFNEFGPITHNTKGEWLPGRRAIVLALTEPNPADEDGLTFFCNEPFEEPLKKARTAA